MVFPTHLSESFSDKIAEILILEEKLDYKLLVEKIFTL
jgi:hypothetical protein